MADCLIALGSNLGERGRNLAEAIGRLRRHPGIHVVAASQSRETAPIGGPQDQSSYLNAAVRLETDLSPEQLMSVLSRIENQLGRRRDERWGPRTIDLDLLLFDRITIETPSLRIPHPRMAWRRFVLEPAAEIADDMVHPTTGWSVAKLLEHLRAARNYVAITGSIGTGKSRLAERLCLVTASRLVADAVNPVQLARSHSNPSGSAWEAELEFLSARSRLLAAGLPQWQPTEEFAISDFWFDQSLAFSRVRLPAEQRAAFERLWDSARTNVVQPKLIVHVNAPDVEVLGRMRHQGLSGEDHLAAEALDRIRDEIQSQTRRPDRGPVLELTTDRAEEGLEEVHAAINAMK